MKEYQNPILAFFWEHPVFTEYLVAYLLCIYGNAKTLLKNIHEIDVIFTEKLFKKFNSVRIDYIRD